ncbi:sulfate ABC transporter, ATPase subunit [Isosphaera pallida ATCC 43644]|uniref:Sulfate ABC transporter, ATPase subunit n=1 Tax=Isosphaera pallida (strain ATCC 43644 / DSM 9630 / IS1B) TaxID=575540 RepID=E8QYU8_ISOPI|nr:sulfate ABC transporter, ATPase subunit [Isosphaera pallida ATCC 43644]
MTMWWQRTLKGRLGCRSIVADAETRFNRKGSTLFPAPSPRVEWGRDAVGRFWRQDPPDSPLVGSIGTPVSMRGPIAATERVGAGVDDVGIVVRHLRKRFGDYVALDDVSFEVPDGQLVGLLGPSGSGKSTVLRIIAGLEAPDFGTVELTGEDATTLPTRQRGVGFVFQHYALFRHMTVRQNIAFGLEVKKCPRTEIKKRVDELLDLVQLTPHAERYPSQLSGGQRQRVALARALAPRPRVLLLDEPFGALDAKVREELRAWLRKLHDEVHVTSLFVTHDQQEAFEVADQVVILHQGRVEQIGPPQELYERPATPFVTEFLGAVNLLRGEAIRNGRVMVQGVPTPASDPLVPSDAIGPFKVYVRPHDLEINRFGYADGLGNVTLNEGWRARVLKLVPMGSHVRVELVLADGTWIHVQTPRERQAELRLAPGEDVLVTPRNLKVFYESAPAHVPDYVI